MHLEPLLADLILPLTGGLAEGLETIHLFSLYTTLMGPTLFYKHYISTRGLPNISATLNISHVTWWISHVKIYRPA